MTKILRRSAFGVLAGLGIVISGVCAANAATITVSGYTFSINAPAHSNNYVTLLLPQFNPELGTLTDVEFSLSSTFVGNPHDAYVDVAGYTLYQPATTGPSHADFPGLIGPTTADYRGTGVIPVLIDINNFSDTPATWTTGPDQGLTLVYDFAPSVTLSATPLPTATPLPSTFPLFATGLGTLGLFGWRRKHKAQASLLGAA